MSKQFYQVALLGLFLSLAACAPKSNDRAVVDNQIGNIETKHVKKATTLPAVNLNLYQLNDGYAGFNNQVTTQVEAQSYERFNVDYKFNSQDKKFFKIISTSVTKGCIDKSAVLYLMSKDETTEINILNKYSLEPNQDYTVRFSFKDFSCLNDANLNLTTDLSAVLFDSKLESPVIAYSCDNDTVLIKNEYPATLINQNIEVLKSNELICGQKFPKSWKSDNFIHKETKDIDNYSNSVLDDKGQVLASYNVKIDKKNKILSFQCQNGTAKMDSINANCQEKIILKSELLPAFSN